MDKCLIECVKYGNKVFTDPEVSKKKKRGNRTYKIYIAAFDNINEAIQDLRVFERFGFNLPKDENSKNSSTSFVLQFKEWAFINEYSDWFTEDLEAGLSGFIGDPNLENLLNDMDTEME